MRKLKSHALFNSTYFARRKVREISILCRNCTEGSYSCFDLPLGNEEMALQATGSKTL